MKMSKIGRAMAFVGLAASASLAAVSPARAYGEPVLFYQYYYYDDAAHTNLIGEVRQKCTYFGIFDEGPNPGQYSQYYDELPIAYCGDGGIEYPL